MQQPETRPRLIIRLSSAQNQRAWMEFISVYEAFLQCLIRRRGVADRDVADVTQQVLLAIAQSVDTWRDDGAPASVRRWLSRGARNVAIEFLSRARRQFGGQGGTGLQQLLEQIPDDRWGQAGTYEYELVIWAAEQVRNEFRETSWQAFWATLIDGQSVADGQCHIIYEQSIGTNNTY